MAKTVEVIEGQLKITETKGIVITTMTRDEIVGKIAEAQTKVDHLTIDLAEAGGEVDKWDNYLKEMDKV